MGPLSGNQTKLFDPFDRKILKKKTGTLSKIKKAKK